MQIGNGQNERWILSFFFLVYFFVYFGTCTHNGRCNPMVRWTKYQKLLLLHVEPLYLSIEFDRMKLYFF